MVLSNLKPETTYQIQEAITSETDDIKKNELRVKYLIRFLSTYTEAPDEKTLIMDVLYGLGVAIDPNKYSYYEGAVKFKEYLVNNFIPNNI